ncbi:hypothetical protein RRG08_008503 [Elysia crispata]|uniref:Uncharacterized protein n=1 Tax=Elysia crispata TaxID=231223 RepID=A0AAE1DBQ2_9GAST|nr:hypothetical protein RRG08_008503 [Elysia crispata]
MGVSAKRHNGSRQHGRFSKNGITRADSMGVSAKWHNGSRQHGRFSKIGIIKQFPERDLDQDQEPGLKLRRAGWSRSLDCLRFSSAAHGSRRHKPIVETGPGLLAEAGGGGAGRYCSGNYVTTAKSPPPLL